MKMNWHIIYKLKDVSKFITEMPGACINRHAYN